MSGAVRRGDSFGGIKTVRVFRWMVAFILLACVVYGGREARAQTNDPPRHVLQRFCFSCHNDRARTGGLALDVL